ncbi:MAG TPA: hypothetical protein VMN37_00570, partial [Gemmatimonadales bacterium]|nr:hypothetical protein [Gemmatimonadales bacterium]
TLVSGPEYVLDVVEFGAEEEHGVELAWHPQGRLTAATAGSWSPAALEEEFVESCERFVPASDGPISLRAQAGECSLHLHLLFDGELLRATGPGVPGSGPAEFLLLRVRGRGLRLIAVLESGGSESRVRGLRASGELIEVGLDRGEDRHVRTDEGWEVTAEGPPVALRGRRRAVVATNRPLIDHQRAEPIRAPVPHLFEPPALDGTLDGFADSGVLALDHEDQYRRSEEPYAGPDEFSARVMLGWGEGELYAAIDVTTADPVFRPAEAPPLLLDNDPDDIHGDGAQIYLRPDPAGPVYGYLVVPDSGGEGLRVRPTSDSAGDAANIRGAWRRTEEGYVITLALVLPMWDPRVGDEPGFDVLVNRRETGRDRRAGQLVWSGGGGWVYLRGDRQDPASFGVLELQ